MENDQGIMLDAENNDAGDIQDVEKGDDNIILAPRRTMMGAGRFSVITRVKSPLKMLQEMEYTNGCSGWWIGW